VAKKDISFCNDRRAYPGLRHQVRFLSLSQKLLGRGSTFLRAVAVLATVTLSGCSSLPRSGPDSSYLLTGQLDPESLPYALVRITPEVEKILERNSTKIGQVFMDRRGPSDIRFGIGDVVSVTLFESAAGGLFIPLEAGVRPGNFVTLPNQSVDTHGNITVPYAGAIQAKGRTVVEVQKTIANSLKDRAIEPQAVVALVDQRATSVSVLGEVNTSSRFPVNASGERLLDAIARAGGPKNPGYDTWVMLERDGRQATAPFAALINESANNIYVRPQDTIYVFTQPRTFVAFGAAGQQGQYAFGAWRLSLAESIGKAGGLNDNLADPSSVFLYRGEPRRVAEQLGVDCSGFTGPIIPIIYHLNLKDPAGYFLATKFEMKNKDVVFASNAPSVETTKFLTYLRLLTATVNDPLMAAVNAYTLRGIAGGTINATGTTSTVVQQKL
jgi:polysaccharide export outer membrane protein